MSDFFKISGFKISLSQNLWVQLHSLYSLRDCTHTNDAPAKENIELKTKLFRQLQSL